jgi:hypothetical protein
MKNIFKNGWIGLNNYTHQQIFGPFTDPAFSELASAFCLFVGKPSFAILSQTVTDTPHGIIVGAIDSI